MKKKLSLFFTTFVTLFLAAVMLVLPASAATYTGNCGASGSNVTWKYDTGLIGWSSAMTLSGTGAMADYTASSTRPYSSYVSKMTSLTINDGITSIGNYAFYNCTALKTVAKIPASVTRIGDNAFYKAPLTSISFTEGVTYIGENAFRGNKLTSLHVSGTLATLGNYAFAESSLQTVFLYGTNEKTIGEGAFQDCKSLTTISTVGTDNTSFEENVIKIPSGVISIGDNAFKGCTAITEVRIPAAVKTIGASAFEGCSRDVVDETTGEVTGVAGLQTVTIAEGVTSIGAGAFKNCKALTSISIPASVTYIAPDAFVGCDNLALETLQGQCGENVTFTATFNSAIGGYEMTLSGTGDMTDFVDGLLPAYYNSRRTLIRKVTVSKDITSIGDNAFRGCAEISSISLPEGLVTIGEGAFQGCAALKNAHIPFSLVTIEDNAFADCGLETLFLYGRDLTTIGAGAFENNAALKTVSNVASSDTNYVANLISIPGKVTSIGDGAFADCVSISAVSLPATLTTMGDGAFMGCTALTSVSFPNGLKTIGDYAFYGCSALVPGVFPSNVTYIGKEAYAGCKSAVTLTLPDSLITLGEGAFRNQTSLISVTVGPNLKAMGFGAFAGCSSIESVSIPFVGASRAVRENTHLGYMFGAASPSDNAVALPAALRTVTVSVTTQANAYAFFGCDALTDVRFTNGCTLIGHMAFYGCTALRTLPDLTNTDSMYYASFAGAESLTDVTLSDRLTVLPEGAFYGCTSLSYVTLPKYLESVAPYALAGCTALENLRVSDSVTAIAHHAFAGNGALRTVTLPEGLISVGENAFLGCTALEGVYYGGTRTDWGGVVLADGGDPIALGAILYPAKVQYTFLNYNDDLIETQKVAMGSAISAPSVTPVRPDDALYLYVFNGYEGFTEGMTLTEDSVFTATFLAQLRGVLALYNTAFDTAWGVDFTTEIKANQTSGAGGYFILYYDMAKADLVSYVTADGVSVTEVDGGLRVTVSREVSADETLLTLTLNTADTLATGEHAFLHLDGDTSCTETFGNMVIYALGDVNMDGAVNTRDAALIKQHLVKMLTLTDVEQAYADAFGDGELTSRDAQIIQQYVVGMSVVLGARTAN